ncbi:MAG: DUF4340 domain-containing protein [Acutalibacteraceae bacterium]|nr:DUF4340 domain-containing protein [Acutalibacteraceae bacterium]
MSLEENKLPEEQEKKTPEYESRVYEVPDEESTIFSAPSLHRDKVKKGVKLKKLLVSGIALVLVAAMGFAIWYLVPKPDTDDKDSNSKNEIDPPIMDSALFKDVNKTVLKRGDTIIEFVAENKETETEDSEGNTTTEVKKVWSLADVDSSLTRASEIDNTVLNYMEQHYTKKISDNKNDGNDYGFSKPTYQVDFYNEGSDEIYLSLIIGGQNPTGSGHYATTSKDDAVYYIAGVSEFYHFQKVLTDFVEPESMPAIQKDSDYSDGHFTNGTMVLCDKLILEGKALGDTYTVVTKDTDHVKIFNAYHIISPVTRAANDDSMGNIVSLFSYGITSDGCYSYYNTEEERKKFGLDDPDFKVTLYVDNIIRSFSATLQSDGNYAVYYEGNKTIMKVAASSLTPAAYTRKDLFNELLFIENINNSSKMTFESGDEKLSFSISTKYDEESKRDVVSSIKFDGKEITALNFQNFYGYLTLIPAQSYDEHDTKGMKPSTIFTIHHKDGSAPTVIEYFKITNARYQVEVDGVKMGLISSSDHTRIMKYAKNCAADKTYNAR